MMILKPSIKWRIKWSSFLAYLSGSRLRNGVMILKEVSRLTTKKIIMASTAMEIKKKNKLASVNHRGRGMKKITKAAMMKIVKLSKTRSTKIVPRAAVILMLLFFEMRYGLASSPSLAGIATMAKKPTLVTEKRES